MRAYLFDLSRFKDTQMSPKDVANIIAVDLGWAGPDVDRQPQDETKGASAARVAEAQPGKDRAACLVFDGLDGANLADATSASSATSPPRPATTSSAKCRVALLAFGRSVKNPGVDPFVLREPTFRHPAGRADGVLSALRGGGRSWS